MDGLLAAACHATEELVTFSVEDGSLRHQEGLNELPGAKGRILSDLSPDLVGLVLTGHGDVLGAIEFRAILGRDNSSESGSSKRLEHNVANYYL